MLKGRGVGSSGRALGSGALGDVVKDALKSARGTAAAEAGADMLGKQAAELSVQGDVAELGVCARATAAPSKNAKAMVMKRAALGIV